jgi:trk system potassium uptake protein TrkH
MAGTGLNWKFVLKIIGFILIIESGFMFCCAGMSKYYAEPDMSGFLFSGGITFISGFALVLFSGLHRKIHIIIGKKESYLSVASSWILFALFGALPFFISGRIPDFTDAFFESVSGITTTGASVLTYIDEMPHALLFWRSLLQWLGGMGIIVFSLALLPLLGGEAAQLFDAESTGLTHDKFRPRVTQMAKRLWGIYLLLTVISILLLWAGPMSLYDAVCHGFATISTGGFSTKQASIAFWDSTYTEIVIIIFMIIGAVNFSLLYFAIKGKFKKVAKDEELKWFLSFIIGFSIIVCIGLVIGNDYDVLSAVGTSVFQIVSMITTTGYSTDDFSAWGPFFLIVFIFIMIVCGCAGSTSGGLKAVRAVVLAKNTIREFERLVHPRAIIPVRLNGNALSFGTVQRLLAFAFLYIGIIFFSWGILTLTGIPLVEALGASISAVSNVGPGFGSLGPSGSFAELSVFAKWYLDLLMVVGRLEIFTVLILFSPGFWKK